MPVVLQIVHGYPPREQAGTEISTARLVAGLRQRGWTCHVFAATRAPGRRQYELLEEPGITRIVNNLPARSLVEGERDLSMQRALDELLLRLRPDLVHVQHLAYIGHGVHLPAPTVGTLHDAWPWCPAGGKLLRHGLEPCPGPDPARCGPCHAAWARPSNPVERALSGVAGGLAALGGPSPERLHGLWRALPSTLRRAVGRVPATSPEAASARAVNERLELCRALWRRMEVILAPSRYLGVLAESQGLGKVRHLPQGAERGPARVLGGPFLYLGTVAFHKGVHVVVEGFRRAFPHDASKQEGLLIHGAGAGETAYEAGLGWPLAGPCPPRDVPSLLSRARALVLGSLWPENAPLVIAEARACGCPVVAPAIGGIPEMLVEGRDGWLYPPGDAEALAACLKRIVREPDLPVEAPLGLDQHVELVEAVYQELLGSRGGTRGEAVQVIGFGEERE